MLRPKRLFQVGVILFSFGSAAFAQQLFSAVHFAGTVGGSGSEDGPGAAARFNGPFGVAVDHSGNVYVADTINQTIRKIRSDGVVTTLAGRAGFWGASDQMGATAQFNLPYGVAVDDSGTVYVADTLNQLIRKITASGVVTTLAGKSGKTGSDDGVGSEARFGSPSGVATDRSGNVYVADTANHAIRKIARYGLTTTLAGSAAEAT